MAAQNFTLFDTTIGRCAIAWSERGVSAFQLPETTESGLRARLLRKSPNAREAPPPPLVQELIEAVRALLRGEPVDLSAVALDMDGLPLFNLKVYEIARTIQPGFVMTYGEIAARLGEPGAARAVGQALGENPIPIIVPCHRVLAAGGKIGGFSAPGGAMTKRRLLAIEDAKLNQEPTLFDRKSS